MAEKKSRPPKPEGMASRPRIKSKTAASGKISLPITPLKPHQTVVGTLTLDDEALIGRVNVRWSRLEGVIHDFIWKCLDLSDPVGRIVTARHDAETNIATMSLLGFHYLPPARHADFKLTLSQIKRCQVYRNIFADATWARVDPEKLLMAAVLRKAPPDPQEIMAELFTERRINLIVTDRSTRVHQGRNRHIARNTTDATSSLVRPYWPKVDRALPF